MPASGPLAGRITHISQHKANGRAGPGNARRCYSRMVLYRYKAGAGLRTEVQYFALVPRPPLLKLHCVLLPQLSSVHITLCGLPPSINARVPLLPSIRAPTTVPASPAPLPAPSSGGCQVTRLHNKALGQTRHAWMLPRQERYSAVLYLSARQTLCEASQATAPC